ncbi:MAG: basic amino acid/polyamine antiporter [Bacillaceae bacterium]
MTNQKLGFLPLVAVVIGTMVGGGVFSLPSDMANGANSGAVIIGWIITAIGMISLALVFQNLANKKPHLVSGVYSYARDGFGEYLGFNSAFGYWISGILGNIATFVLLFNALSYFIPVFEKPLFSFIGMTVIMWALHFLVLKGVKEAAILNVIATIAKLLPIGIFLVFIAFAFKFDTFTLDFWGGDTFSWSVVGKQVKDTMLVTLWVFIGVEGAVVLSARAKRAKDVGRATVVGLLGTMIIYVFISVLSLGVMPREELAGLATPSMAYVLESVIGKVGAGIINFGLCISLFGTLIGWTLLVVEVPFNASKDRLFPKILSKSNEVGSPSGSLWTVAFLTQTFFLIVLFSESTYQVLYTIATTSILFPYLFSALYQVKLLIKDSAFKKDTNWTMHLIIGLLAVVYSIWIVFAAGMSNLLIVAILYMCGIPIYLFVKKEYNEKPFTKPEYILLVFIIITAVIAIYEMAMGYVS